MFIYFQGAVKVDEGGAGRSQTELRSNGFIFNERLGTAISGDKEGPSAEFLSHWKCSS